MSYDVNDIRKAVEYAENLTITAGLDPRNSKTLVFEYSSARPDDLPNEILDILDICIEYHQRCIFNNEYQSNDVNPPISGASDPIVDINFYLNHYQYQLVKEIKKGLSSGESDSQSEKKVTDFTKAMLKMKKRTQKR